MPHDYQTDLKDDEWKLIERFFISDEETPRKKGREPYRNDPRDVVDAIFYRSKTGCQWRLLPNDFPHHSTVSSAYYRWVKSGKWQKINDLLRKIFRTVKGDRKNPSQAIIDSQSVKTVYGGENIGFDGGKKNQRTKTPISRG